MLRGLRCRVRGHEIDRHRVWHDDLNFRTTCQFCHASLLRDPNGWRVFDAEKDFDIDRSPHPHFDRVPSETSQRPVGGSRRHR